jgi:hypothetical protein
MPKPLVRALLNVLRLSEDYVGALLSLEGADPGDVVREFWRDRKRVQRQRERWRESGDVRGFRSLKDPVSMIGDVDVV